eukprot:24962_1
MTDMNCIEYEKFNLEKLIKCYDHIICVHLFCLKSDARIKIKEYVCNLLGKCKYVSKCESMKAHSLKNREENIKQRQKHQNVQRNVSREILMSCLNSLHCYLLHDPDKLYRLERGRGDNKAKLRFSTQTDALQFVDEFDEFIGFIAQNTAEYNINFVDTFVKWLMEEQYDW